MVACNSNKFEEIVKAKLSDPESAVFKDEETSPTGKCFKGLVNSKNRFGGYVGFHIFAANISGQVEISNGENSNDISVHERYLAKECWEK